VTQTGAEQAQLDANTRWAGAGGKILAAVLAGSWSLRSVSEDAG